MAKDWAVRDSNIYYRIGGKKTNSGKEQSER